MELTWIDMKMDQAPVVQRLDNAIHWINRYQVDVLTKQTTLSAGQ